MTKRWTMLAAILLTSSMLSMAKGDGPATKPVEPLIGEMRVATLAPIRFVYTEVETSFATLPKDVGPVIRQFQAAVANTPRAGTSIFRYPPIKDMSAKFTLEIGIPVPPGTPAPAGLKVVDLPAFKCATLLYTGPVMGIKEGFSALFQSMGEEGLKPAGECREAYLYFETPESDNDITQIQMAIQ